jgi:hypothetical protein
VGSFDATYPTFLSGDVVVLLFGCSQSRGKRHAVASFV